MILGKLNSLLSVAIERVMCGTTASQRQTLQFWMLNLCLFCSDGTLNPNGVRFGSSEIYNIGEPWALPVEQAVGVRNEKRNLKKHFFWELKLHRVFLYAALFALTIDNRNAVFLCLALDCLNCLNCLNSKLSVPSSCVWFCLLVLDPAPSFPTLSAVEAFEEVTDSLCVPQYNADGEERVILFLKMAPGRSFTPDLVARIKGAIRKALSARHVPGLLLETKDIPVRATETYMTWINLSDYHCAWVTALFFIPLQYTISGKKVEVAVKQVIAGREVAQRGAFSNPESLDLYKNIPELQNY